MTAEDATSRAVTRAEGGAGGIAVYVGVAAITLAALSLLGPAAIVSLAALVGVVWLFATRRRKAGEKHAGLRTLR